MIQRRRRRCSTTWRCRKLDESLLVRGRLRHDARLPVRALPETLPVPAGIDAWTCHLPLQGEECAPVANDCVDLTPYMREDILLEFPQHPLCKPDCRGLPKTTFGKAKKQRRRPGRSEFVCLGRIGQTEIVDI